MSADARLPMPEPGPAAATAWVAEHLRELCDGPIVASPRFRGGQRAADAALAGWCVRGYAGRRSEVWPAERRGASGLSPYIRHGLLPLARVWQHVDGGPASDVARFRDQLLWQEYARHLYARLGARTARPLRARATLRLPSRDAAAPDDTAMTCVSLARAELERDGWIPNQMRMWLASHTSVRGDDPWRAGEDAFFRHLLDGSRAANRLGWQWTVGLATGRPYGFSRWQVRKRAPGLCETCALSSRCPIERWPDVEPGTALADESLLAHDPDVAATAGPETPLLSGHPERAWITAESLGDADPALAAHPAVSAIFVFDAQLLARVRLSGKRLVFLAETLAELATRRSLEIWRGAPSRVLAGHRLAATFAPVPGWRRIAAKLDVAALHPWQWLVRPDTRSLRSYTSWRRAIEAGS